MRVIVTTTIHSPTEAIHKFIKIAHDEDWYLYIVGDLKTPDSEYTKLVDDRVKYLTPEYQSRKYHKLSWAIGWNCIQRRNIGFIEAYKAGAEVIATVDDDNIPLDGWGKNYVNEIVTFDKYKTTRDVFDPLQPTDVNLLWHRGFPIELLHQSEDAGNTTPVKDKRKVLVQADLWNGDPDIDAICRTVYNSEVRFDIKEIYGSDKISPFNSQNTFLSRKLFPNYFLFPGIGRMDDIWASYITQLYFPNSVIYAPASVYQKRNKHNLIKDLKDELLGYEYTYELIKNLKDWHKYIPERSLEAYELYLKEFI